MPETQLGLRSGRGSQGITGLLLPRQSDLTDQLCVLIDLGLDVHAHFSGPVTDWYVAKI
jgi:hypothetical protein